MGDIGDIGNIGNLGSLLGGGDLSSLVGGGGGDPIAMVIDELGSALGLPKELTGAAKIGAAVYTGDVMCGVSGGMDVMQGAESDSQNAQCQAATTECPDDGSSQCEGYGSDGDGDGDVDDVDSDNTDAEDVDNDEDVRDVDDDEDDDDDDVDETDNDAVSASADGDDDNEPASAPTIATNNPTPAQPPVSAAQGGGQGPLGGIEGFLQGGLKGIEDLASGNIMGSITDTVGATIKAVEGLFGGGGAMPVNMPPPTIGSGPQGSNGPATVLPPGFNLGGTTERSFDAQYRNALTEVNEHFDLLDTAAGIGTKDGVIAKCDLEAAVNNPNLPTDMKQACRFLLDNPAVYNQINAAGGGTDNGFITKGDVQAAMQNLPPERPARFNSGEFRLPPEIMRHRFEHHEHHEVEHHHHDHHQEGGQVENPPTNPENGPGSPDDGFNDIGRMAASGMDIEEIVEAVLEKCLDKMDDQIKKLSSQVGKKGADAAKQSGNAKTGGASGKGSTTGSSKDGSPSLQDLQFQLQDLTQKRQQLFSMITNISSGFNETSKQILQNMGRA